jgi:hypothetical protein
MDQSGRLTPWICFHLFIPHDLFHSIKIPHCVIQDGALMQFLWLCRQLKESVNDWFRKQLGACITQDSELGHSPLSCCCYYEYGFVSDVTAPPPSSVPLSTFQFPASEAPELHPSCWLLRKALELSSCRGGLKGHDPATGPHERDAA